VKLLHRFFLILAIFALTPVLVTGAWFWRANRVVEENARLVHLQFSKLAADMAEDAAVELNRSLAFISELERSLAPAAGFKVLQQAAAAQPRLMFIALDDAGREIHRVFDDELFGSGGAPPPPETWPSSKDGRVAFGRVFLRGKTPLLPLTVPLREGRAVRVIFSLKPLWDRVGALRVGASGRLVLLDAASAPLPGFEAVLPQGGILEQAKLAGDGAWIETSSLRGRAFVGALAPAKSFAWRALTLQPRREAFALDRLFAVRAAVFLFILCVLVAVAAAWVTGHLSRPLLVLVEGLLRVERRDYSTPIPDLGWGELKEAPAVFNRMMATLEKYQRLQIEAILAEKTKVDALVSTIPDGILLADMDGAVLFTNPSADALIQESAPGRAPASRLRDLLPGTSLAPALEPLLRRETTRGQAEIALERPSGRHVYACRAMTMRRAGKDMGILLVFCDVTTDREMERIKEEFLHGIVHDLKGPLTTIDGFLELMRRVPALGEREIRCMEMIGSGSRQLRTLIADILDTAKIEAGRLHLTRAPLDLEAMLKELRLSCEASSRLRGTAFDAAIVSAPAAPMLCDAHLISRVLANLVSNAFKFTPAGGRVSVRVEAVPEGARFVVQDTGYGIPADKLEFVFEKFKQLAKEEQSHSGYGLGLHLCRQIVELHGGRIWVESESGRGASFIFTLPFAGGAV
jgi:two-component system phosphate regulon sensor histidine kinase PhoR